ncbi:unnamed protein product [Camellia sinensis]
MPVNPTLYVGLHPNCYTQKNYATNMQTDHKRSKIDVSSKFILSVFTTAPRIEYMPPHINISVHVTLLCVKESKQLLCISIPL